MLFVAGLNTAGYRSRNAWHGMALKDKVPLNMKACILHCLHKALGWWKPGTQASRQ